MPERRVVITGMGVVTPVGNGLETFWSNLKNGVSGIRTIDAFDTTEYDCKIGGQVRDFDPKQFFKNPKDVRRTDRFTHLAMAAAKMAVADSGIDIDNLKERDRFGVIVSTGIGGLKTLQDQLQDSVDEGARAKLALHDPNVDQQHGRRRHLDGVRPARSESLYRYRMRYIEQRHR